MPPKMEDPMVTTSIHDHVSGIACNTADSDAIRQFDLRRGEEMIVVK
jgi:hypothetical protein